MQVSDMNQCLGGSLTEYTRAPASFLLFLVIPVVSLEGAELRSSGGVFANAILCVARPHHLDWLN
jgi:hypothetical protein